MKNNLIAGLTAGLMGLVLCGASRAQEVCLPAPRLLTIMPMGCQAGTSVEVTITGENLDEVSDLLFSHPKISAKPTGEIHKFVVTVAADAPPGVHDARVMSRLGISSARAYSVSRLPEVTRVKPNNTLETALELKPNSICNAVMTPRAVDFYSFQARSGVRVVVECATRGIDSKLNPVLIIADDRGHDRLVDRRGGLLDFEVPADGKYFVKVHGLTFQGGPESFYRLALLEEPGTGPAPRQPVTAAVGSFSWVPDEGSSIARIMETEPNNLQAQAQKIMPPCEIVGRFYPAADVDSFEFAAKKGEEWWVEVVSERLGLPTDPFVLVQRVTRDGDREKLEDVAEFNDIASPIKPSSNGYSYDGPPYDAGSADALGKLVIKEDGVYRLQLRDLFGGTRSEPRHVYRLIIRKGAPDFALVAWALHMNLRNGDRNALSKPVALRAGSTMAFEVVTVRRDGFEGEIELGMIDLPEGVTACGLKIPAGKSVGTMLISASESAPRSLGAGKIVGHAQINGKTVTRPCRIASMVWPVKDASQEIPVPRLFADLPVSVSRSESAPVTVEPAEHKVWQAKAGTKLTIPLKVTWRSEFAGASLKMSPLGVGLEGVKELDIPLKAPGSEVVIDLAALKTPPGEYSLAFLGSIVDKYRYNPEAVRRAEDEQKKSEQDTIALAAEAQKLADEAKGAPASKKAEAESSAKAAAEKLKLAETVRANTARRMKAATDAAMPKDVFEIVVSEPIRILVSPTDQK